MNVKNKIPKSVKLKTYVVTTILLSLICVAILQYALSQAYVGDVSEVWVQPPFHEASYVVGKYNSTFYYAQNSTTGELEFLTSNATFVVQSCLDNLPSIGGKVSLVGGNYYFTTPLIFPDKTFTFAGINQHTTILYAQINGDYLIKIGDGVALYDNIHIEDAWLRPDSGYTPSGLVFINYSKQINFRRVAMSYLTTAQSYCVYADSSWTIKFFESTFFNTQNCIYIVDGYIYASDTYFDAYDYGGASGEPYHYGVYALNSHGNFHRCTFETNPTTGIGFLGNFTRYSNFIDCHFEAEQNLYDVWLTSNCDRNSYVIAGTGLQNDWYDPSMRLVIVGNSATGDYGWFIPPRIAHPTTTGWTTNQTGFTWYCTTHDLIEMWNGTHIVDLGTGAQGPAGESGTLEGWQPYSYLVFENATATYMLNGETGDIDDSCATSATQIVFNWCIGNLSGGGLIYVVGSTYTVNDSIDLDTGDVTILGEQYGTVTFSASSGLTGAVFHITSSNNRLEHFGIDCNVYGTHGIHIDNTQRNIIYDVWIQDAAEDGIRMTASAERNSNKIIDCTIRQPRQYGIYIGANIGHSWIERTVISDSTGASRLTDAAIYIASSMGQNVIYDNAIWGTDVAIHLSGSAYRLKIDRNTITDCWTTIEIQGSNGDVSICNNLFWYVGRNDPSPGDHNSDLYFNTGSTQYAFKINDNNSNGQSVGYHFINCTNSNIFSSSIMDGNCVQGMSSTEYDQGTQSGLTVGDNA